MAVERKPLSQLLSEVQMGQDITNKAISGQGFDPQGGWGVAAAQIATAGIGAWAQNRARKEIAEQEMAGQKQFSDFLTSKGYTPESASAISALSTPEARNLSIQEFIKQDLKGQNTEPQTVLAKLGADYKAGLIDKATYNAALRKETSFAPDSSSSGGATGAIIANLRRENPNLSYAQALTMAQGLARQGLAFDTSGNVAPIAGLVESKSNISAAESKGAAVGKKEGELAGKSVAAPQVLSLVKQAEELLPKATSGRLQGAYTAAAQFAGKSTEMSKADAKLNVIAAGLTSNVPRMEGPQSDADTKLYKQAAGDVANKNLPTGDRMSALQTIKAINEKYLTQNTNQQKVRKFNPQTGRLE